MLLLPPSRKKEKKNEEENEYSNVSTPLRASLAAGPDDNRPSLRNVDHFHRSFRAEFISLIRPAAGPN